MTLLFSVFKLLLTDDTKNRINSRIIQIKECRDWSDFNIGVSMGNIEISNLNYNEVVDAKNMLENIAKLSINLMCDFEYYQQFLFESQYCSSVYTELLDNLGCVCVDGKWRCMRQPDTSVVQTNVFMYCLYRHIFDEMRRIDISNENIGQTNELAADCFSAIDEINNESVKYDSKMAANMAVTASNNIVKKIDTWICVSCESVNTFGRDSCLICFEPMPSSEGWICEFCDTGNSLETKECDVCRNDREVNNFMQNAKEDKMKHCVHRRSCEDASPTEYCNEDTDETIVHNDDKFDDGSDLEENICGIETGIDGDLFVDDLCSRSTVFQDTISHEIVLNERENIDYEATIHDDDLGVSSEESVHIVERVTDELLIEERVTLDEEADSSECGEKSISDVIVFVNETNEKLDLTAEKGDINVANEENSELTTENIDEKVAVNRLVLDDNPETVNDDITPEIDADISVDEKWICANCKFSNQLDDNECKMCNHDAPHKNMWRCKMCTFINDLLAPRCSICCTKNKRTQKSADINESSAQVELPCYESNADVQCSAQSIATSRSLTTATRRNAPKKASNYYRRQNARKRRDWACQYCSTSNPYSSQSCFQCMQPDVQF